MVVADDAAFEFGYEAGQRDEQKRHEQRDEMLLRLSEACEQGSDAVSALAREWGVQPADDLPADINPADLIDDLENWLREQSE